MKRKIVITCTLVACLCLMLLSSQAASEKQAQAGKTDQKAAVTKVTDPVCHMEVDPAKTKETATYKNKTYHFCSSYCKNQFEKDPGKYSK